MKKIFIAILSFCIVFGQQNISAAALGKDSPTQASNADWGYIEELFTTGKKQTLRIESCLQQIEQVIHANKIKFNKQKISKSQLLQELKDVREIIHNEFKDFEKTPKFDEGLFQVTILNHMVLKYLLPIVMKDITDLSSDNFIDHLKNGIQSNEHTTINDLIEENSTMLNALIQATDVVGLTPLNKAFRFIEQSKVPGTNWPLLSSAKYGAYGAAALALAYSSAVYLAPHNTEIPWTSWNTNDLPFKNFLGSASLTDQYMNGMIKTSGNEKFLGVGNTLDTIVRSYSSPIATTILGSIAASASPLYSEVKTIIHNKQQDLTNYLRGDIEKINKKNNDSAPRVDFKDIVGGEHLKQLAYELSDFIKYPDRYQRTNTTPPTGILLAGPSQVGKTYFVHALQTLINDESKEMGTTLKFESITQAEIKQYTQYAQSRGLSALDVIFDYAIANAPYILFFDEIDMFAVNRDKNNEATSALLTNMTKVHENKSKPVIVIAATNRPETLDFALLQNGRFGTVINFTYPSYEDRKSFFIKKLTEQNIQLPEEYIDAIAQETAQSSFNTLNELIKGAFQRAQYQGRPVVQDDFEVALDRVFRKITPNNTLSQQEAEVIATYHAGQAVARHVLETQEQVVKITIDSVDRPIKFKDGYSFGSKDSKDVSENNELLPQSRPKSTRFGSVFTISPINNQELVSNVEQEKEMLVLLAGQAALKIIQGQEFDQFGKEDRAIIIQSLENKFSQGAYISDAMRQQAIDEKNALYQKAKSLLAPHKKFIEKVAQILIKQHTINKQEWMELIMNYNSK